MRLPWRAVSTGRGPDIVTSLTEAEAEMLAMLAVGRRVLEVGSAYGYSAVRMGIVARHVTAVDPHSGHGAMPDSLPIMRDTLRAYGLTDKVTIALGRSSTVLSSLINCGAQFDLAFIDGDHRRGAVENDLALASGLLAPGGIVAAHDYGEDTCPGVRDAIDAHYPRPGSGPAVTLTDTLWVWRLP